MSVLLAPDPTTGDVVVEIDGRRCEPATMPIFYATCVGVGRWDVPTPSLEGWFDISVLSEQHGSDRVTVFLGSAGLAARLLAIFGRYGGGGTPAGIVRWGDVAPHIPEVDREFCARFVSEPVCTSGAWFLRLE